MPAPENVVLDIETDWSRRITVLGFQTSRGETVQLVGNEITKGRLLKELPRHCRLFTYNGHCFDLPVIRTQLGVDLRERHESHDLRFICQRVGLTGGQKVVEKRIGVKRKLDGFDGVDALELWAAYKEGDESALNTLLEYNREDLRGLNQIRVFLVKQKVL